MVCLRVRKLENTILQTPEYVGEKESVHYKHDARTSSMEL